MSILNEDAMNKLFNQITASKTFLNIKLYFTWKQLHNDQCTIIRKKILTHENNNLQGRQQE
jgi:hypothetical protein